MSTKKKRPVKVKPVECYAEVDSKGRFTPYDIFPDRGLKMMSDGLHKGHRLIKVKITPID